jgi:hypothetical protein
LKTEHLLRHLLRHLLLFSCLASGTHLTAAVVQKPSLTNPNPNQQINPAMNQQISEKPATRGTANALLKPWIGEYGGLPPWDLAKPEDFLPAFEVAIKEATTDVNAIADNEAAATFENTIVALEKSGSTLDRVSSMFQVHASNLNLGTIPDIQRTVNPLLSKHQDSIMQNKKLFARVDAVPVIQALHHFANIQSRT